jgi:hypothetical protein
VDVERKSTPDSHLRFLISEKRDNVQYTTSDPLGSLILEGDYEWKVERRGTG